MIVPLFALANAGVLLSAESLRAAATSPVTLGVVAGLVVGIRRKGDSQVFVQLEDGRGRLECGVFAEAAQEMSSLLVRDRVLVVREGLINGEVAGDALTEENIIRLASFTERATHPRPERLH